MTKPKVAIVHDWLIGGGAEKVVEAIHQMYPDAPIYASYATDEWRNRLNNKVITGFLQNWPFSKLRKFIPFLRIKWFESLDLSNFDLVISSSGAEAKGVKISGKTKHIAYIHAPTHYYWSRYDDYLQNPGFGIFDPLARIGLKLFITPLKKWDYQASQRPNTLIANSTFTQRQIKKYYHRDSSVVFPPVDINRFKPSKQHKRSGFVIAGRQTPYKRFDLAVKACSKLNLPLLVIGNGPDNQKLRKLAGRSVTFKTNVSDEELTQALQSAEGFIFPGIDDFGIVAVEALSAGCPVIAYKNGGALDYITPGKTGYFFDIQTVSSLAQVLKSFKPIKDVPFPNKFSPESFKTNLAKQLSKSNL